jgi:hypothetical protein
LCEGKPIRGYPVRKSHASIIPALPSASSP